MININNYQKNLKKFKQMKTAEYAFKAYYYSLNVLPPLIFAILYTVTYNDIIGDEWSVRCIVDTKKQNKMDQNTPWLYNLKKYPTDASLSAFLLKNPSYVDITNAYSCYSLVAMLINFGLMVSSVYECYKFHYFIEDTIKKIPAAFDSLNDAEQEPLAG